MFVDTNVLVYARFPESPRYDAARSWLERASEDGDPLRVSRQVLREYLSVVTRPLGWPVTITREEALADVEEIMTGCEVLEDGPVVTASLIELCRASPRWRTAGSRRQHRRNHAGARRAKAADVQHRRLPPLRRPHRVGGAVGPPPPYPAPSPSFPRTRESRVPIGHAVVAGREDVSGVGASLVGALPHLSLEGRGLG